MTQIGDRFTHHHQPYGTEVLQVEAITPRTYKAWEFDHDLRRTVQVERITHDLRGRVIEGRETARLLQFTSTRDTAGEVRWVYGVSDDELAAGQKTSVACG